MSMLPSPRAASSFAGSRARGNCAHQAQHRGTTYKPPERSCFFRLITELPDYRDMIKKHLKNHPGSLGCHQTRAASEVFKVALMIDGNIK